jgi:hypothetical protein
MVPGQVWPISGNTPQRAFSGSMRYSNICSQSALSNSTFNRIGRLLNKSRKNQMANEEELYKELERSKVLTVFCHDRGILSVTLAGSCAAR